MAIYWGDDLCLLYNDAWRPIVGNKHPWSMGRPGVEVWPEIWDAIHPLFRSVSTTGKATWRSDELLPMQRYGYTEECYFDYTFNPIRDENGKIAGILNIVQETTYRVLNDRRISLLRELSNRSAFVKSDGEAFKAVMEAFATNPADIAFAILYAVDADRKHARLIDTTGLPADSPARIDTIDLTLETDIGGWPLASALQKQGSILVNDLSHRFGMIVGSLWPEPSSQALVVPLHTKSSESSVMLVMGINPRRRLDEAYRHFLDNIQSHIATAIANARVYEEERKRAEALAELDRAKTEFFSNVSHEFRTPLTLMLGPLEELKAQFGRSTSSLDASQYQQVDLIHRNGLRLLKLVNTLLDFSRIEAGREQALYEETDLAAFTADLASVFRSTIEKAGLSLIVDCPPLPEPVFVDRDMWEKIVLNLLSNAFKFTFVGEIEVALRPSGRQVELFIRDTGTGIPDDQLGKIFERFHRVAGSHGRTYEGTGIGLSLVQELARLHGGSVSVESRYGKGSTFRVFIPLGKRHLPHEHIGVTRAKISTALSALPFVEEAARWLPSEDWTESSGLRTELSESEGSALSPQSSALPGSSQHSRPRVLLADDNADMREYLSRLLRGRFEVQAVADGQAALEAARADPPDVVLTDVMMPRVDGFGLLRALRDDPTTKTIPVILLSAIAGEESRIEGLKHGADDYLVKPFSARELLTRVEAHTKMARMRLDIQAALRESEARFRTMADTAPAMLWVTEPDGSCSFLSRGWYEFTGQNEEEALGKQGFGWLDAVHPDDRERAGRIFLEANEKQESFTLDYRLRRADGEYRWAIDTGRPRFGRNGEFLGYIGSVLDITERTRTEEALRASEEETKRARDYAEATLRTSPVPLLVLEKDLRVNTANEAFYHTFRVNPAETQGRLVYELGNGQWNMPKLRELLEYILPQHTIFREFEVTHDFEFIGRRTMLLNARRMENEPDSPERIVLVIEDITDRKRSEEAKARLAAIVASSDDAIIGKNLQGIITSWNKGAERIFGYAAAEAIGQPIMMLIPPQRVDEEPKILASVRRGETVAHYETVRRRKDGADIDISLTISPIRDETGNIIGASKIARDITERKRAEEALRRLNDELEQRVADRTRDLMQSQNRLRAMATELNLAEQRERKRLATELHDHLQQTLVLGRLIVGQGKRGAATVPASLDVMMKLDGIFSEALTYTRTLVADLSPPVLRDHGLPAGLKWLGQYMKKHQITVTVTVPENDDLKLPEDQAVLLFQSVRELLINSSKHAGTREATVRMEQRDGLLRIEVRDEGAGFDLAAAAAAAGTPSGGISSKFGLFSIQERMLALGGSFEIESVPGKGTIATLVLPVGASAELSGKNSAFKAQDSTLSGRSVLSTQDSAVQQHAKIRVLLVDDHPMMRQGLRSIVTAYAHLEVVGEAGDGVEAVELAQRLDPDVVVMDINMPKMDGIEATRRIKANQPTTVVIGLSVNQSTDTEQKMKAVGASTYLTKESALDALCHAIEQAISCKQAAHGSSSLLTTAHHS